MPERVPADAVPAASQTAAVTVTADAASRERRRKVGDKVLPSECGRHASRRGPAWGRRKGESAWERSHKVTHQR
ncbi:hypothetical protein Abr02nite_37650 [Paractinoplanes brasiliensis]|nr:hypothetical protein Abr02nite_37650 [Actinoplanes brasiliensis]